MFDLLRPFIPANLKGMIPIGVTLHCLLNSETSYTYDSYLIKGLKELLTPFYKSPIHGHYPNSNQNPLNLVNPIKTLPLQDSRQPSRSPPRIFRKKQNGGRLYLFGRQSSYQIISKLSRTSFERTRIHFNLHHWSCGFKLHKRFAIKKGIPFDH